MAPIILQCPIGPMGNFAYILGDPDTKRGAVIDPGWEAPLLADQVTQAGLTLHAVLFTHTHFDHTGALEDLCMLTRPEMIYVHVAERENLPLVTTPITATNDGDEISLGSLRIRCLHTPGHSPGGQCLLIDDVVFTGDTLFIDGCGRVDLPGSDPALMWESLQKVASLPPSTTVYAGHDYGPTPTSTIGEQRKSNAYLSAESREAFFGVRGV